MSEYYEEDSMMEESVTAMPFEEEAEQAVLGLILLDPNLISEAMQIIPAAEYFYLKNNRMIYQNMIDLFTLNMPIEFITVLNRLKGKEGIDEGNMKVYLYQLTQMIFVPESMSKYCMLVKNCYLRRKLIEESREIIKDAMDQSTDINSLVDSAEQRVFNISNDKVDTSLERINTVIYKTFEQLDILNSEDSDAYAAISTGISALDKTITGLNKTDLIILAARPGMGKTSFALNIARHVGVKAKKRVAFFSLEMSKEQLVSRLLSTEGLIQGTKLRTGKLNVDEWTRLIEAGEILSRTEIYLDDSSGITVPQMKAKLRRLRGVDLVIIDYLQLMQSSRRIDNRVQEISEITRSLKIMAKELNVPVITLSQLSRESEKRAEHEPQLSDLRDSGSIEQDADIVLFLYREGYRESMKGNKNTDNVDMNSGECIVAKNRHGETRSIPLHWQGEFMRFTSQELSRGE